jgi:hypothetical protein
MINPSTDIFIEIKKISTREKKIIKEILYLYKNLVSVKGEEEQMVIREIDRLKKELSTCIRDYNLKIENLNLIKPLYKTVVEPPINIEKKAVKGDISWIEKNVIKRFGKEEIRIMVKKETKPRAYVEFANKLFFNFSEWLVKKYKFTELNNNLIKANMQFIPENYISIVILWIIISFISSMFITGILVSFDFSSMAPFISPTRAPLSVKMAKYLWLIAAIPICTGLFLYNYPSLEKKASASKINQELPFATIHMAAIAESMLNPKGVFEILIKKGEYKALQKEFTKLINEINIHGMNLVNALRNSAVKSPSSNLTDLFNGIATTINSGGSLKEFFDKRSQTLLFEHKIAREKSSKIAETFMDIYISIVIAAPMIFMLLLMIMNVSGMGISLTPSTISLLMIIGVALINFIFLVFLHIKNPSTD